MSTFKVYIQEHNFALNSFSAPSHEYHTSNLTHDQITGSSLNAQHSSSSLSGTAMLDVSAAASVEVMEAEEETLV